jgi:hypothetical protein
MMALPCPGDHGDGLLDKGQNLSGPLIKSSSLSGNKTVCCSQEDGLQHGDILVISNQFITGAMGGSAIFDQSCAY